jgi:hypothetical protein
MENLQYFHMGIMNMFISYAASAENGFKKWSAAHPPAKYAPRSDESAPIALAVSDVSWPRARQFRPITAFARSTIHIQRAARLRENAEAAPAGGALRARLLDLALQYDRMAANWRHESPRARHMSVE